MQDLDRNLTTIALHSEFVGKSQLRVRTRKHGNTVIMVDVFEYGPTTSKKRAASAARDAARIVNRSGGSVIFEYETEKPVKRLDPETGNVIETRTRVRSTTFLYANK